MLILARKISEAINTGNDIKFAVVDVQGEQVRVGLGAPKTVAGTSRGNLQQDQPGR
jgi:carbon storage regulator